MFKREALEGILNQQTHVCNSLVVFGKSREVFQEVDVAGGLKRTNSSPRLGSSAAIGGGATLSG